MQTIMQNSMQNSMQTQMQSQTPKLGYESLFDICNPHEKFNVYSHLVTGLLVFLGLILLLFVADPGEGHFVSLWVYGFSLMFVFFASTLWHSKKKHEDEINIFTQLDEIAIFIAIAGAFTPIAVIFLDGTIRSVSLTFQWLVAFGGTFFKIRYAVVKRWITAGIYLIMGWSALIPIQQALQSMPDIIFTLLIIGGIFASIGAILFVTKKPKYFHEIFHVLISLAMICHYSAIFLQIFD